VNVDRSRLPEVGPDRLFALPRPQRRRLDSGLTVWSVEHRGLPVVACLLVVPVGSAHDPAERPGLAALAIDMLDEGAGTRDAVALHDALARIGAHFDSECVSDTTVLGVLSLSAHAGDALGLLADIAFRPRLAADDFERLRTIRRRRLSQMRDVPSALADRVFVETLFEGHPYGHLPIGTEAALDAIDLDQVHAFHARAFQPSRATLILVGDLDHDQAVRLAELEFRTAVSPIDRRLPAGDGFAPAPPASNAALARHAVVIHRPSAQQSELRIGRIGVSRSASNYHALVVANAVLGGQFTSRINLNLRERKGYTYGARSYFDFRKSAGPFVVAASVQTDATNASVREVFAELDELRAARPVTGRELELSRWGLTRGYARNFETPEQIARAMAQLVLHDLPDDTFDTFVPRVRGVDASEVSEVAARYFDSGTMFTVIVGDRAHIEPGLHEVGFSRCTVVDAPTT
jgi:predicted Zn-dependent peptidase